jgi:hypothetical protein
VQTFLQAGSLNISDRVDAGVQVELARRGHRVATRATPIATPVMLAIDPESGILRAAGDPAARRHAAGLGSG